MNDLITLELPRGVDRTVLDELQAVALASEAVEDVGTLDTRALDPASLGVWVQLAGGAVGLADRLIDVVTKLLGIVRDKGIKGAKLKLENVEIELGAMSVDEFERVVARLKAATAKG
jgi:hypothetical protein